MSATYNVDKAGNAYITLSPAQASTFHTAHIRLDAKAAVTEANNIVLDASMRFYPALTPNSVEDEDDEEREWDALFALPHVQAGLSRLAAEAERQFAAGETEEGGFAVE